jgi:hypothetical protein
VRALYDHWRDLRGLVLLARLWAMAPVTASARPCGALLPCFRGAAGCASAGASRAPRRAAPPKAVGRITYWKDGEELEITEEEMPREVCARVLRSAAVPKQRRLCDC